MKRFIRYLIFSTFICLLVSCATTEPVKDESSDKAASGSHVLFDAWNDASLANAAVEKLIKQADIMMRYEQWDEAQGKLERTLRVSIRYAPAWSRLSWLSLRAAKHNKAIQLALRSNSYTDSRELKQLNWSIIRDANKLLGNSGAVAEAIKMIDQLQNDALYPQGVQGE